MEIQEFNEETNRLTKYYDKEYNEYQLREIYNALKDLPIQHYRRIVNYMLRTEKFLPKLVDLLDAKEKTKEIETNYNTQFEKPKQVHCDNCKGSGLIKFIEKRNGGIPYEYLARCNCENARQYDSWVDKDGRNLLPSAVELNLI